MSCKPLIHYDLIGQPASGNSVESFVEDRSKTLLLVSKLEKSRELLVGEMERYHPIVSTQVTKLSGEDANQSEG